MFYSSRIRQFLSLFFIVSTIVILSNNSFAQSGPGGVGNADGSNGQPENVIWYAADSLNLSNSDNIQAPHILLLPAPIIVVIPNGLVSLELRLSTIQMNTLRTRLVLNNGLTRYLSPSLKRRCLFLLQRFREHFLHSISGNQSAGIVS